MRRIDISKQNGSVRGEGRRSAHVQSDRWYSQKATTIPRTACLLIFRRPVGHPKISVRISRRGSIASLGISKSRRKLSRNNEHRGESHNGSVRTRCPICMVLVGITGCAHKARKVVNRLLYFLMMSVFLLSRKGSLRSPLASYVLLAPASSVT
jgi:hypothetical protein